MPKYYSFSDESVQHAVNSARDTHSGGNLEATSAGFDVTRGGEYSALAECISVTVENHAICVNLPLGMGKHCISIPISVPDGTAAQACLTICTTWGIPTGVKVSVIVAGVTVVSQTFGKC